MNPTHFIRILFSGIMAVLLTGNAAAALVTYTYSGTGSGAVGAISFSNADFLITAVADTSNREIYSYGAGIEHDIASIDISGVGSFNFTTGTRTFINNDKQLVGFSQALAGDLFNGPTNPAFSTWGLDTSIGPVAGSGELLQWNDLYQPAVYTTGGQIYFLDDANVAMTFQASVVPVPAAIWLFGSGLLGLIGISKRGKSA